MTLEGQSGLRRLHPSPKTGIVHLGLGAFFRAHGAIYIKEAMEQSGGDWGVVGVSLRSSDIRNKLVRNDCLYTALELSDQGIKSQVVDVVTSVLFAPEDPSAVLKVMTDETTRIVSLTITEKGYCRGSRDTTLDFEHPDIKHDLQSLVPKSGPGFLVRALEMRWRRGLRPFTVLSLDNLSSNGLLTQQIVSEFASRIDLNFANWVKTECKFPCSMVDRIVPATSDALRKRACESSGHYDEAVVAHEPFRQWVIEDDFVDNCRPDLGAVGVKLVYDVAPFEQMKLRMLNGAHSAIAYLGSLAGFETVAEAICDEGIALFVEGLWREDLALSLDVPPETSLEDYAAQLLTRFRNPEIYHLLEQIAMDGSQKLPQRILGPLFENLSAGRPYKRLLVVVAAWLRYIESRSKSEQPELNDPYKQQLIHAAKIAPNDAALVENILKIAPGYGKLPSRRITCELVAIMVQLGNFRDTVRLEGDC